MISQVIRYSLVVAVIGAVLGPLKTCAGKELVVGGKNFTEQYLLAELAGMLLSDHGFDVTVKSGVGSALARRSLENRQFDLYFEYSGTAYTVFFDGEDREIMTDPEAVYEWVRERDTEEGLVWLEPLRFNNTYTLLMQQEAAEKLQIESITDLGDYVQRNPRELSFGVNAEFWERPDGFRALMRQYDFRVPVDRVRKMSTGLTYMALRDGLVDVAMGFSTDGRVAAFGFVSLDDDRDFFPVYNPAAVVRAEVLEQHPEISAILEVLVEPLTTDVMRKLNAEVDVKHRDAAEVAGEWLREEGLLD